MSKQWIDQFPALTKIDGLIHGFICRHPGIDVKTDRETAIARLQPHYTECLETLGIRPHQLVSGEQVHGSTVRVIGQSPDEAIFFRETDGFVTDRAGLFPGVYVADCGAVFLVDPVQRASGLVHSGKNGSEKGIAGEAIRIMKEQFGSRPRDLIVQLGPCIRVPDYEVDFPAQIRSACLEEGVPESQYFDCGISTSRDLERYYSYRIEKGETGRLLAVVGFAVPES